MDDFSFLETIFPMGLKMLGVVCAPCVTFGIKYNMLHKSKGLSSVQDVLIHLRLDLALHCQTYQLNDHQSLG